MDKHEAVLEFLRPAIEQVAKELNFNFSPEKMDAISVIPQNSDKLIKRYVRVGAKKEYVFQINAAKEYSQYNDRVNLEAIQFVQRFMDWIEEKNKMKEYPSFPENCKVEKMEVLQNMPALAGVNMKEGLALYTFQGRIVYIEKEE